MLKSSFLKIFFIGFFCFITINVSYADTSNISKISFITDPQTIKPNEVSKELTIQIQDSSGNKVVALETIRFDAFQTTSATGVFVSCTTPTNPPTDYIAKNSSNKNVCYKDSTEGTFTITAKTNNTVTPLIATQSITISSQSQITQNDSNSSSTATSTETSSQASSQGYYSNYSSVYLTDLSGLMDFKIDAGRERTASVNSPINFKSRAVNSRGDEIYGGDFTWTFGDGSYAYGREVNHTYEYPGEYIVVVNARYGNQTAVSRTRVRVVEANISISDVSLDKKYITLTNKTNAEINLYNWRLMADSKSFIFPIDTIVLAKNQIKIPSSATNFDEKFDRIMLFCPNGNLVSTYTTTNQKTLAITTLNNVNNQNISTNNVKDSRVVKNEVKLATSTAINNVATVAEAGTSVWSRLLNYPRNLLTFFIKIFETD